MFYLETIKILTGNIDESLLLNLPGPGHLLHWSENEFEAELCPAWAWSVQHTVRAQATHIFKPRISHAIYKWLFLANLVAENRDSVLLGWPTVPHRHRRQRCTLEIFLQLSRNSHAASDANCRSICLTLQENCWDHRFKVAILICFAWVTSHFQVIIPCVSIVIRNNNITARNYNDNKYWPPLTLTPHPRHSRPRPRWRGAGGVPHGLLPPDLGPQPPGDLLLLCPHPIPPVHRSSDLSRSVTSHPPSSGLGSHHPALNTILACCLFPHPSLILISDHTHSTAAQDRY